MDMHTDIMQQMCPHLDFEMKPTEVKNVHIQRCQDCGFEMWHHEDSHG